jgi:hypothetical protein
MIEIFVRHLSLLCIEDMKTHSLPGALRSMYQDFEMLIAILAFIKHPSFKAEEEFRMILLNPGSDLPPASFEQRLPRKFRVSGSRIIPYIQAPDIAKETSGMARLLDSVRKIVIGPGIDYGITRGIMALLKEHRLEVEVTQSKIPYRP